MVPFGESSTPDIVISRIRRSLDETLQCTKTDHLNWVSCAVVGVGMLCGSHAFGCGGLAAIDLQAKSFMSCVRRLFLVHLRDYVPESSISLSPIESSCRDMYNAEL